MVYMRFYKVLCVFGFLWDEFTFDGKIFGYMCPVAGRSKGACMLYFNNFVVALAMRAVCVGVLAIFWVGIACLCCVGGTIFGELHSFENVVWNVRFGCRVAFAGTIRCYVAQIPRLCGVGDLGIRSIEGVCHFRMFCLNSGTLYRQNIVYFLTCHLC